MPMPNLSSMSVDALLKLRDDIGEVLTRRAAQLRDELSRLSGGERRSRLKGRKVPVKYRDRSGNTWAGRGAQPTWLREKLKAGAKLEDFAVHKTAASPRPPPRNPRNVAGLNAERVASSVSGIFLMVARQTVQLTELAYEPSQPRY